MLHYDAPHEPASGAQPGGDSRAGTRMPEDIDAMTASCLFAVAIDEDFIMRQRNAHRIYRNY